MKNTGRIKDTETLAYINRDEQGEWRMIGWVSGTEAKRIISLRRANGDVAGTDYRFDREI